MFFAIQGKNSQAKFNLKVVLNGNFCARGLVILSSPHCTLPNHTYWRKIIMTMKDDLFCLILSLRIAIAMCKHFCYSNSSPQRQQSCHTKSINVYISAHQNILTPLNNVMVIFSYQHFYVSVLFSKYVAPAFLKCPPYILTNM